ncbi:MAG: glutathione S-transferase family protein [Pseudomonadota bacterium]|nr:glutathione S-transferase family protein [Pseudomonadota bacterium]
MTKLTLISHHLCPYVMRAAISLAEKGVEFNRVWIDLSDKPEWFARISPLGKVPVLVAEDGAEKVPIFESAAILEFLEDTQPNPMHPADPVTRARHRGWMEFGSATLNAIARLYNSPDAGTFASVAGEMSAMFARLEDELASRPCGPWFSGARLSLVDAVYGPVFRYFDVFDEIGNFGILADMPNIAKWRRALAERPSVRMAAVPDYNERLKDFLVRRRSHVSTLIQCTDRNRTGKKGRAS